MSSGPPHSRRAVSTSVGKAFATLLAPSRMTRRLVVIFITELPGRKRLTQKPHMNLNRTLPLLPLLLVATAPAAADDPPSYARQVRPFLAKYCSECHSGEHPKAGLNLET